MKFFFGFRIRFDLALLDPDPLPKKLVQLSFLKLNLFKLDFKLFQIVHAWKSNCLPLRFWVNFIKNPDFIFDVNKTVSSFLLKNANHQSHEMLSVIFSLLLSKLEKK